MKTVSVRYLKAGAINIEVPKEILEQGQKKLVEYCQKKIEETPDYILKDNLSDYDSSSDDFFDEAPEVEQITDTEDDYKTLFSTNVWDVYSDSDYADNILAENKNMAEYLKQQGLSEEEILNICCGSNNAKRGSIEVYFVSLWDGCTEIQSLAKLDVDTGEVHSIETIDVEQYDITVLSLETARIYDQNGDFDEFDVIQDYEGMEFAVDSGSLSKINELIKQNKVSWINEGVFHKVEVQGREFAFQLDTGTCDEPIQPFNGSVLIDDGEAQFTISVNFDENQLDLIEKEVRAAIIEKISK